MLINYMVNYDIVLSSISGDFHLPYKYIIKIDNILHFKYIIGIITHSL